MKIEEKSCN